MANTQPVAFDLPLDAYEILKRIQQEREETSLKHTYSAIIADLLRREDKRGARK